MKTPQFSHPHITSPPPHILTSLHSTWLLAAALAAHAAVAGLAFAHRAAPDLDYDRYWQIASTPGVPYRDYPAEHPIGTLLLFKGLAAATGTRPAFAGAVVAVNLLADAAIICALGWAWGLTAAAAFALGALPIIDLLMNRLDLWSTAAATFAVAAWARRRGPAAGASLAIGAAFKLWPSIFAVLLFLLPGGRRRIAAVGAFAGVSLAMLGLWWAVAGSAGFYEVLTFRGATGWQIESTVGSAIHLLSAAPIRFESGSWRIGATSGALSIVLFFAATPAAAWLVWRGAARGRPGSAWLSGVSALLLLSALFSAQFMAWLLPGAAIAWVERDRAQAALAWAAMVLTGIFWLGYGGVLGGQPFFLALVAARNAALGALVVTALRD